MTDIVATVQYDDAITVVNAENSVVVSAVGIQGASAADASISTLGDVDTSALNDGSVLVYKMNTHKWTSTLTLDAQNMEGGHY